MRQHSHKKVWFTTSARGVGNFTLLVEGKVGLGKCFMHTLLAQGNVGLASSRQAQWPHLCYPEGSIDVVPTKTPGFLHHPRWRSSSFVEHFAQVLYTFWVFRALFLYRYLLVRRQSICILSLIFLCHWLFTDLSVLSGML